MIRHGGCLGLGLAGMGTADQGIYKCCNVEITQNKTCLFLSLMFTQYKNNKMFNLMSITSTLDAFVINFVLKIFVVVLTT